MQLKRPPGRNGSVFTCVQGPGRDPATLIAYDPTSGVERWRHAFTDVQHGSSVCTAPVAAEDRLYLAKNSQVHDFDINSGLPLWQSEPLLISGRPDLTAADGLVFVNGELEVFAIEAATGALSWRFDPGVARPYGMISPPSVDDGRLVIAVDKGPTYLGEIIALDADTGFVLWRLESYYPITTRPVVAGERVYADYQHRLVAFDAASGREVWRHHVSPLVDIAVVDNVIYVLTAHHLLAIDARTGEDRWQFTAGSGTYQPVVADGVVYLEGLSTATGTSVFYAIAGNGHVVTPTGATTPRDTLP